MLWGDGIVERWAPLMLRPSSKCFIAAAARLGNWTGSIKRGISWHTGMTKAIGGGF